MDLILVGERANQKHWRPTLITNLGNLKLRLALGAFTKGAARKRLKDLGLRWKYSINLLWPDPQGTPWREEEAALVVSCIRQELERRFCPILLIGKKVQKAFVIEGDPLEQKRPYILVPHPSGLNRWWNDFDNLKRARELFNEVTNVKERS